MEVLFAEALPRQPEGWAMRQTVHSGKHAHARVHTHTHTTQTLKHMQLLHDSAKIGSAGPSTAVLDFMFGVMKCDAQIGNMDMAPWRAKRSQLHSVTHFDLALDQVHVFNTGMPTRASGGEAWSLNPCKKWKPSFLRPPTLSEYSLQHPKRLARRPENK